MFYVYKVPFRQYERFSVHVIVRDKAINQLKLSKATCRFIYLFI